MRESWFFMYLSMFLSKSIFSFQVEDSGRKIVELGWESFIDNLKILAAGWENYDGDLKSWTDD